VFGPAAESVKQATRSGPKSVVPETIVRSRFVGDPIRESREAGDSGHKVILGTDA